MNMRTNFGQMAQWREPTTRYLSYKDVIEPSVEEIQNWKKESCFSFMNQISNIDPVAKFEDAMGLNLLPHLLDHIETDYTQKPVTIWDKVEEILGKRPEELKAIVVLYKTKMDYDIDDIRKHNEQIKSKPLQEWKQKQDELLKTNPDLLKKQMQKKAEDQELNEVLYTSEIGVEEAEKLIQEINKLYFHFPKKLISLIEKIERYIPSHKFPPEESDFFKTGSSLMCKSIKFFYPEIKKATEGLSIPVTLESKPLPSAVGVFSTKEDDIQSKIDSDNYIKQGNQIDSSQAEEMLKVAQKETTSDPAKLNLLFDYLNKARNIKSGYYEDPLFRGLIMEFHQCVFPKAGIEKKST